MRTRYVAVAAMMLYLAASSFAYADQPGSDWMPADQVIQQLMGKGYTDVSKLEADDGRWEAKATLNGVRQKVYLDPHSGEVVGHKPAR
jgi:hypothetical protein